MRYLVAMLGLLVCVGCGGESAPVTMAPVKGKVTFEDGSIPKGEICNIIFSPVGIKNDSGIGASSASGVIGPDGSFVLTTYAENDGAAVGAHKVSFSIYAKYDDGGNPAKSLTPPDYVVDAEVPAGGKTDFVFKIPKRK